MPASNSNYRDSYESMSDLRISPTHENSKRVDEVGEFADMTTKRAVEITYSPELAEAILTNRNSKNRPLTNSRVQDISDALTTGTYEVNGQTISFGWDGQLMDGQHRLWASVLSGIPITSWTVFGVDPATFESIDQGGKRTAGEVLAMDGKKYANMVASVAGILWHDEQGHPERMRNCPSRRVVLEVSHRHPLLEESCAKVNNVKGIKKLLTPRIAGFCHYRFSQVDREATDRFFEDLALGANLSADDPVMQLRNRLIASNMTRMKIGDVESLALTIKAWNFRRQGKAAKSSLRWNGSGEKAEDFPRIK